MSIFPNISITDDSRIENMIDEITDVFKELVIVPENRTGESQRTNSVLDLMELLHEAVAEHQKKTESGFYHERNEQWLREVGC
jgi:hypothetical protein